jgi:hypothetical protein
LSGDNLREIVNAATEMGEAFLDPGEVLHEGPIARAGHWGEADQPATTWVVTAM